MLNIYIQLQNKGSYFLTSRRLSPNPAHIKIKIVLKIKIIHICSKNKQTRKEKRKTNIKAHKNKQTNKKQNKTNQPTNKQKNEKKSSDH